MPRESVLWPQARVSMARLLAAGGKGPEAVEALRPLLSLPAPGDLSRGDPAPRALLLAGRILAEQPGGGAEARRIFLDCWAGHALSGEAKECRTRLEALPAPDGGPPGDEDALRRAEALLDWNRNEQALAEARRLGERLPAVGADSPLSCRAAFVRGKALRKLRQYGDAAEELGPVVELCTDPALRPRALYLLSVARANVANGAGIESYRRFAREYPEHAQSDDALYFASDLLIREGRVDEALALLAELVERYPDGDFRADAIFREAWLKRRRGDLDGAVAAFGRIEELYRDVDPYEHARALYWRGRTAGPARREGGPGAGPASLGGGRAALPGRLLRAAGARPAGGGRNQGRRPSPRGDGGEPEGLPLPVGPPRRGPALPRRPRAPAARPGPGGRRGARRRGPQGARGEQGAPGAAAPARRAAGAGRGSRASHRLLRAQGRQVLREPPAGMGLRVWQMAYPPAWRDQVVRFAPAAGVPPDLLQALMREESALDPAVVSPAGAVGLTQLMVRTAAQTAKRLALPAPSAADLTDPRLNIRLGASYLGDLLKRFGGSAPLALAAYNAGEGNARAWWRSRGSLPLDEFVEEIPIQETRGYVKRVLRSYSAYRMLYGRDGERPVRLVQQLPPPPP